MNSKKVAGIVLAAGSSSRFGKVKQLLPWCEKNLVNTVLEKAHLAGLSPVILVLGANAQIIQDSVLDQEPRIVINPEWEIGQSSSIKKALSSLAEKVEGALFLLCDQPHLSVHLIASVAEHGLRAQKVIVPYVNDRRANPVYFPAECFPMFEKLEGNQGGRKIIGECAHTLLPWLDEWMARDIDTESDYIELCQHYGIPLAADKV